MLKIFGLILSLFIVSPAHTQLLFKDKDEVGSIVVDNIKRTYLVHTPSLATPTEVLPNNKYPSKQSLVFILHGNGGTGNQMRKITNFNTLADANRAIVVYPNGVDEAWNDGRSTVRVKHIDDVKFFKELIYKLKLEYNIDKVYVSGLSNGAMMALRLSCEAPTLFSAVAAVSASIPRDLAAVCRPSASTSRLMIVGTQDPIIPYNGGEITSYGPRGQGGTVLGINDSLDLFKKLEKINTPPLIQTHNNLTHTSYSKGKTKLEGYVIVGGMHTWDFPPYNTNTLIWNFFINTK